MDGSRMRTHAILVVLLGISLEIAGQQKNDVGLEVVLQYPETAIEAVHQVFWQSDEVIVMLTNTEVLRMSESSSWDSPISRRPYPNFALDNRVVSGVFSDTLMAVRTKSHLLVSDSQNDLDFASINLTLALNYKASTVTHGSSIVGIVRQPVIFKTGSLLFFDYNSGNITELFEQEVVGDDSGFVSTLLSSFSPANSSILYFAFQDKIKQFSMNSTALTVEEQTALPKVRDTSRRILGLHVSPQGTWVVARTGDALFIFNPKANGLQQFDEIRLLAFDGETEVSGDTLLCFSSDERFMVVPTTEFTKLPGGSLTQNYAAETLFVIDMSATPPTIVYHDFINSSVPNAGSCSFKPSSNSDFAVSQARVDDQGNTTYSAAIMRIISTPSPTPSSPPETPTETTAPPGNTHDDSACFPGSALVELQDGTAKQMQHLTIGDRVRVSPSSFSAVFMWTHKSPGLFPFLQLHTSHGSLTLSRDHFVHTPAGAVAARAITAGDYIIDGRRGTLLRVTAVRNVVEEGLFNPQTLHGDIVVDGVLATTYTEGVAPRTAHVLLAPLRWVYEWTGMSPVGKLLEKGSPLSQRTPAAWS